MTADDRDQTPPQGLRYRDAGVDIDAQDEALRGVKRLVRDTRTPGVLSELGSFGGLFEARFPKLTEPVLVSSCDGVGTKLRVAFQAGVHDSVGRDLVNHCVNDILVQGARPLFFMDYFATGRLAPSVMVEVVSGIAAGCRENGCALLGGETAEMPGFYADGEYDVAGFIVGVVDRGRLIDGSAIRVGDAVYGLESAGLHTNGYSLARKVLLEIAGLSLADSLDGIHGTIGQALLAEHRSYLRPLSAALEQDLIRGLAHITGGGLTDNIPRILPEGAAARIVRGSWSVPPLFSAIARLGRIAEDEMYRTFNMGIGMVAVVAPDRAAAFERVLAAAGENCPRIGEIVPGNRRVLHG